MTTFTIAHGLGRMDTHKYTRSSEPNREATDVLTVETDVPKSDAFIVITILGHDEGNLGSMELTFEEARHLRVWLMENVA